MVFYVLKILVLSIHIMIVGKQIMYISKWFYLFLLVKISLMLTLASQPAIAACSADNHCTIQSLRKLDLKQLLEIEIILDDTFDIFSSLVSNQSLSIATGKQKSASLAPAVTTVITDIDIEAMGANNINEVLAAVPGLHVMYSSVAYRPIYLIRGISSYRNSEVLILLDGVPVNNFQIGYDPLWYGIGLSMIKRIEIMRGPGSALFGADAVAGVINIITKTAQDMRQSEFGARIGSFNTYKSWLNHSENWGGLNIGLMLEMEHTDGHNGFISDDLQSSFDRIFASQASLAPGEIRAGRHNYEARLNMVYEQWQWRLGYQQGDNMQTGVGIANNLDHSGLYKNDKLITDLSYHNPYFTDNWEVGAQLSYYHRDYGAIRDNYIYPAGAISDIAVIGNPGASEKQTMLTLTANYKGYAGHNILFGAGYRHNDVYQITHSTNMRVDPITKMPEVFSPTAVDISDTDEKFLHEGSRSNWHLFIQDSWEINPHWELTTGIRYDYYSNFGKTINPRFALVRRASPELTQKLLYGRAFRTPVLSELNIGNNPVTLGNPNLQPESIDMLELVHNYRVNDTVDWTWNIFAYELQDKIVDVSIDNGDLSSTRMLSNIGWQKGHGFEVETRWKINNKFSLLANYAWQKSRDMNDSSSTYTPRHQAYIRADLMLGAEWYLDAQVHAVSHIPRAANDPRPRLNNSANLDLTLYYKSRAHPNWHARIGVRNVFDSNQRSPTVGPNNLGIIAIPHDLPLAGRNYFLELRYRF
jgi:outer membrane receptor protein involved in Fe transport